MDPLVQHALQIAADLHPDSHPAAARALACALLRRALVDLEPDDGQFTGLPLRATCDS